VDDETHAWRGRLSRGWRLFVRASFVGTLSPRGELISVMSSIVVAMAVSWLLWGALDLRAWIGSLVLVWLVFGAVYLWRTRPETPPTDTFRGEGNHTG